MARLPCYCCKAKNFTCQLTDKASKCIACIPVYSRCNPNSAVPSMKPQLEPLYLERLFNKNPDLQKFLVDGKIQIAAKVTKWDPPSTKVKTNSPKKVQIPEDLAKVCFRSPQSCNSGAIPVPHAVSPVAWLLATGWQLGAFTLYLACLPPMPHLLTS